MALAGMRYLAALDDTALDEPATRDTLAAWQAECPTMGVLALLPEAERAAVPRLQALFRACGVPLAGAVFPALVDAGAFRSHGAWLLRIPVMAHVALHTGLPHDAAGAAQLAAAIAADVRPHLTGGHDASLFLLFDACVPNISTILDALYLQLANRVHYMGVNAGSETFQPMPCLFDSDRWVGDALLVVLLDGHRGAILEHGYAAPARLRVATSTVGNRIVQIDWQPAFEVYQTLVLSQFGVRITPENFYAYAVHFPFGIVRADGEVLVRIPVAFDPDGALVCLGEVPADALLTLLDAPAVDSAHTLDTLVRGLAAQSDAHCEELLLFYCAGRRGHLGADAATRELASLDARIEPVRVAGALSLGEIGSTTGAGYPLFHNATLVAARWCPP